MNHVNGFLKEWGDAPSLDRIRSSDKAPQLQKCDAENYLKEMALRFQYSPNQSTTQLWASDMVDAGFKDWHIKEVCKSAPFKFEKHPTLAQLMELLRPYLGEKSFSVDELNDLSNRSFEHLKRRFVKACSDDLDLVDKAVSYYVSQVYPGLARFNKVHQEMCFLNDWLRSYFGNINKTIEQGKISNEKSLLKDREYFTLPLKRYVAEHKL
jgi:hypothetical protein